ncbi:MAG: LacI family DNA-binding transcriptional regulator [Pseudomonadota bacterium]
MDRLPTLDDVAKRAGVSTATVSRTLNFPKKVRAETRETVENAVRDLGYTPNFAGRVLASNRTNTIGAVIPTMDNAIFARGIQALEEELAASGITLLVATSQYEKQREDEQIRTLLARGIDGLILIGEDRAESLYDYLDTRRMPYVLLWTHRHNDRHITIGFDNVKAARALTERVLEAGHRTIAMIAGTTAGNDRARDRVAGVRAAMENQGLTLVTPYLVEVAYGIDVSERTATDLLSLSPRPSVIICGNDVQATGALRAARKMGLAVPLDLSIIGFDDIDLAQVVEPPLTTVRVPHARMGRTAARTLVNWIKSGNPPERVMFDTDIVMRQSLAPPA